MILSSIRLTNYRSYHKASFEFSPDTTVIIGQNTAGKSNLMEAITYASTGKSFRSEKDEDVISFGKEQALIHAVFTENDERIDAEVKMVARSTERIFSKRYFLNGVPKRRVDFAGNLLTVLFDPSDLEIIIAGPSLRRRFLDDVLEQTDRDYRLALVSYTKALRQRNALLGLARETGRRDSKQFAYWDEVLIRTGQEITEKREAFIEYMNGEKKVFLPFQVTYDKSVISEARLAQYQEGEIASGVTLVGPHRDDFIVELTGGKQARDIKSFGSRGQQRLCVLEMKLFEIAYIEKVLGMRPTLLLDDIFSELDSNHIALVLSLIGKQQTILTTTHEEFLEGTLTTPVTKIMLEK